MSWIFLLFAWIVSMVATMGSLFFSEVMKYPPCVLCWYQRIAMYPMIWILLVGLFSINKLIYKISLPICFVGWVIASYHNLLYYKILPESAAPCAQGISCTAVQVKWLGFITIPLLSLVAFCLMLLFLTISSRKFSHAK